MKQGLFISTPVQLEYRTQISDSSRALNCQGPDCLIAMYKSRSLKYSYWGAYVPTHPALPAPLEHGWQIV